PLPATFAPVIFAPHSEQKSSSEEECPFGQEYTAISILSFTTSSRSAPSSSIAFPASSPPLSSRCPSAAPCPSPRPPPPPHSEAASPSLHCPIRVRSSRRAPAAPSRVRNLRGCVHRARPESIAPALPVPCSAPPRGRSLPSSPHRPSRQP